MENNCKLAQIWICFWMYEENLFVLSFKLFNSAFGQFRALLRFRTKQAFGFELVLVFISLGGKST